MEEKNMSQNSTESLVTFKFNISLFICQCSLNREGEEGKLLIIGGVTATILCNICSMKAGVFEVWKKRSTQ